MRNLQAIPLALPAASFWLGLAVAGADLRLCLPLVTLLVPLGLAWRHRGPGVVVLWLALGMLRGLLVPASELPTGFEPERPVTAQARVTGDWRLRDDRASVRVRVSRVRQGLRVSPVRFDAWLSLPEPLDPAVSELRVKGYLSPSPVRYNEPEPAPGAWRLRVPSERLVRVEGREGPTRRWARWLRRRVEAAVDRAAATRPVAAALARSLLLGRSDRLPDDLHRVLGRAGAAHVLALSGLHVGFLLAAGYMAGAWLPRGPRWVLALAVGGLYLALAGPRPALVRATVMATAVGASVLARRIPSPGNALALAALGVLIADPRAIAGLGFRLTVSATAGLLLLTGPLAERWGAGLRGRYVPTPLRLALAASVAAQLATQPWIGPVLAGWSPAAPVVNLVAVPWAAGALGLSWAWLGSELLGSAVGFSGWGSPWLASLDTWLRPLAAADGLAAGPWWFVPVSPAWGHLGWLLASAAAGGLLLRGTRRRWAVAALVVGLSAGWSWYDGGRRPAELVALDVGQGDALLLRRGRHAVLVDGGGLTGGLHRAGGVLVPALARLGVRRLDAVVLTHPDGDHCSGLPGLVDWLPVKEVWVGPGWDGHPCADRLLTTPGARIRRPVAGHGAIFGELRLEVLYPRPREPLVTEANDRSLVLRAGFGDGRRVLLTGDIGRLVEERLVARHGSGLRADLLKVAHHGSRHSSGRRFLAAVGAPVAVVSAGRDNVYGHPHPDALERLRTSGARVAGTHRRGQVRVRWAPDGAPWIITPYAPVSISRVH